MKRTAVFALMLVAFMSCMALTSEAAINASVFKDAILFSIVNDVLRFNSVHTADVSVATIKDETGSGITSIAALQAVLGTPDTPPRVFQSLTDPINIGNRTLGSKAVTATLEIGQNNRVRSITITGIRERPILGISWSSTNVSNATAADGFERLGGYAVFLPRVSNAEEARAILSQINGFAATGGEDWHPGLYQEGTTPHGSQGWNILRDMSDLNYLQQAVSLDVPLMGYCRGKQGFNIAMGGGLIQDVPYHMLSEVRAGRIAQNRVTGQLAATTTHRVYRYEDVVDSTGKLRAYSNTADINAGYEVAPYTTVSCDATCSPRCQVDGLIHSGGISYHKLAPGPDVGGILPNSKWVYNIVGDTNMEWVRTAHHQFANPNKLGNGITIVAYASDGVVEAIEHQDSLFAVGVQWHPEANVLSGPTAVSLDLDLSTAFLREHVRYAGIHKDRKALINMFNNGELPEEFDFDKYEFEVDNSCLTYTDNIVDEATLLSNAMLNGWTIAGVDPQIATNWSARVVGGAVVVTLIDDVEDETVTVTLTNSGLSKKLEITFSGEITIDTETDTDTDTNVRRSSGGSGCSAAHGYLALAFFMGALPFIISRRK